MVLTVKDMEQFTGQLNGLKEVCSVDYVCVYALTHGLECENNVICTLLVLPVGT